MVAGNDKRINVFFAPSQTVMKPKTNVVKVDVSASIEPIHEICTGFNGPLASGVSSDVSFTSAGETHPINHKLT